MLRLILKCVLIILILAILHLALLSIQFPVEQSAYLAASIDKKALLEDHTPGSILIVGGSSAAFSYDSAYLQSVTGQPVINTSLHIGLGLRYMLDSVSPYILPGDVIILNLEYEHYVVDSNNPPASDMLRQILGVDFATNFPLIRTPGQWLIVLKYHPEYTVNHIRQALYGSKSPCPNFIYCRESFNSHGDVKIEFVVSNAETKARLANEIPYKDVEVYNAPLHPTTIQLLKDFNEFVTQKGAQVFIVLPAIPDAVYDRHPEYFEALFTALGQALPIEIIGQTNIYPIDLFYDTMYHLNDRGRSIHMQSLAELIRNRLNSS
ncbi:hypothetical protein MASR2M15_17790 [Anaerolineales bacterium]